LTGRQYGSSLPVPIADGAPVVPDTPFSLSFHNQLSEGVNVNKAINKAFSVAVLSLGLALAGSALADTKARAPAKAPVEAAATAQETVNINTADAATLARVLQGIGDSKAQAIVQYREEHGDFVDAYELANVKGVGERTVELNEDRIVLKD
jgi:competence ComEA-like helix-hairpin-helix protein